MASVYWAFNFMPSTVPSILHTLVKEVLVVLHFRREGTEEQRQLPDVTCTVREQSPSSPATSTVVPQHTQAWVRKTTSCLGDGALDPLCWFSFPGFCRCCRIPRPQRGIPLSSSFTITCFYGDFLACTAISRLRGVWNNMRAYPGLVTRKRKLNAPGQLPALFPFESGPTATAWKTS